MDIYFDLLITEATLNKNQLLQEEFQYWGGEQYSQDPQCFSWSNKILFKKQEIRSYLWTYLPKHLQDIDWVSLSLQDDSMNCWEKEVNDKQSAESHLKQFIRELDIKTTQWVIICEPNGDQIDVVYKESAMGTIQKIEDLLDWRTPDKGFISWHL